MSPASRSYQIEQGGRAGEVYYKNGVKFDAYEDGRLIEAKGSYDQFFRRDGEPYDFWLNSEKGDAALIKQARDQVGAAGGAPVEWRFATPRAAEFYAERFRERGLPISVRFVPPGG